MKMHHLSWSMPHMGAVDRISICEGCERPISKTLDRDETDFRVLQATQDTDCRFLFVTRDWVLLMLPLPLVFASCLATRKTF